MTYDLVATLCEHTSIGSDGPNSADSHMWYITLRDSNYESGDIPCMSDLRANITKLSDLDLGTTKVKMLLHYDYGSTTEYDITFEGSRDMDEGEDEIMFPRNNPINSMPAAPVKFVPDIHFDDRNLFPNLHNYIFGMISDSVIVNLFQPRKKKHFGFLEKEKNGCRSMIYLPVKPTNLTNYLLYFDQGAATEEDGYHNWHSVVLLPRSQLTEQLVSKYKSNEAIGFCDGKIVSDENHGDIVSKALHDLFCIVEGFLRTL